MEFKLLITLIFSDFVGLKVLSYWNLNDVEEKHFSKQGDLKVLSYWNLNGQTDDTKNLIADLKYYHIGI